MRVALKLPRQPLTILVGAIGLLFLFPVGYLIIRSVTLGADFAEILLSAAAIRPLANSLLIATATAILAGPSASAPRSASSATRRRGQLRLLSELNRRRLIEEGSR